MADGFATKMTPTKHKVVARASNRPQLSFSIHMARRPVKTGAMKVRVVASPTGIYTIRVN